MEVFRSVSDVARHLNLPTNGTGIRKAKKYIEDNKIEMQPYVYPTKYEKVVKTCPVCSSTFTTLKDHKKEQTVCSISCSNTFFRSGENNPNWKDEEDAGYRRICFTYHDKKCIICDEDKLVAVHHYDEDHSNNSPENLIPMCPTHHGYVHSKWKHLVEDKVREYRERFISRIAD